MVTGCMCSAQGGGVTISYIALSVDEGTWKKVFSLRSSVEEVKERGLKAQT